MSGAILGLAGGTLSQGIGICLLVGGEVQEAVTVPLAEPSVAVVRYTTAVRTVQTCWALLERHNLEDGVVWAVADIPLPGRITGAVVEAAMVRAAVYTVCAIGPAMGGFAIDVPVTPADAEANAPESLRGPKPSDWLGETGERREAQRLAWAAAVNAVIAPATQADYVNALVTRIATLLERREAAPTADDTRRAAAAALSLTTKPADVPVDLTADQVARHYETVRTTS